MVNYIKESFEELKTNVTWPTWAEGQRLMVVVAVFSILFSLAIWGIDSVFVELISLDFGIINEKRYPKKMAEALVKNWYVVRAVSGQENKVKSYIENEIARLGFSDYVDEVLVPTEKVVQVRNGKKINKERVYFPGYVMVKANLGGEVAHIIKSITGVIGFLGEVKGGDPVPLRKSEVNRMLGKVDELSVKTDNVAIPFVLGETVKVIDGPFNGFNGTVEKVNEEKRKLEVMVKIFGRKTPLELSYMQVEKV